MGDGHLDAAESLVPTVTRTPAGRRANLEYGERLVEALPFEEENELDWFISLLVASNASKE